MMKEKIRFILEDSIRVKQTIIKTELNKIERIAEIIIKSLKKGGKLIIFGNGGSAGDSQHIAAELVGRFQRERKAIPAVALTTNSSIITSLANDYSYDIIFERQIEALAEKKDVAMGISSSGEAKNVILGIAKAKKMGLITVILTGKTGGKLAKIADIALIVPSQNTARIQESHITIGHILCQLIEGALGFP